MPFSASPIAAPGALPVGPEVPDMVVEAEAVLVVLVNEVASADSEDVVEAAERAIEDARA